eukprot:1143554-Amorphochlora_amoeboformis.AAC.1
MGMRYRAGRTVFLVVGCIAGYRVGREKVLCFLGARIGGFDAATEYIAYVRVLVRVYVLAGPWLVACPVVPRRVWLSLQNWARWGT